MTHDDDDLVAGPGTLRALLLQAIADLSTTRAEVAGLTHQIKPVAEAAAAALALAQAVQLSSAGAEAVARAERRLWGVLGAIGGLAIGAGATILASVMN